MKAVVNIAERAASTFLMAYLSSAAVLAGGFGTKHDLQIAGAAGVTSLLKNVAVWLTQAGNGPDVSSFDDGGADK